MAAFKSGDCEGLRVVDRIRANAYREAMDAGAGFITRDWVAHKIGRSARWVTDNWRRGYDNLHTTFGPGAPRKHDLDGLDTPEARRRRRRRKPNVSQEIKCQQLIPQYNLQKGMKAFHTIQKPIMSAETAENRLLFCEFLSRWEENDFLHLCPSDEFFIWTVQNDWIWTSSEEEVKETEEYEEVCLAPNCIGVFLCFTVKRLLWVIKEEGQSWTEAYFREKILGEKVIPFLMEPRNVSDPGEVCFLHDSAPYFLANETQNLMKDSGIDFFDPAEWPEDSPDLNPTEYIGAILKEKVESKLTGEQAADRYSKETLVKHLQDVMVELEFQTDLFESLLRSYPARLQAVQDARGFDTTY